MKIAIAPDSFKESLTAIEVAAAMSRGVRDARPDAEIMQAPMADGGEGTVDAVVAAAGGRYRRLSVPDPLGRPVTAHYGLFEGDASAVIEMAAASGLHLLSPGERNPLKASTRGVGTLMLSALDAGVRRIIVGVGGSATVDGGIGMAAELGAEFYDSDGSPIKNPNGAALNDVRRIGWQGLDPRLKETEVIVACDVTNPLVGDKGAARVYGPQKGADERMVERLEAGLQHFAGVIKEDSGLDLARLPGGGAAGGLGAGLAAFAGAQIESGIGIVMEVTGLEEKIRGSDLVLTGEGKADDQSAFGKVPAGVGGTAARLGVPAVVLAGQLGGGYRELYSHGITAAFAIADGPMGLDEALEDTPRLLRRTAEAVTRLFADCQGRNRSRTRAQCSGRRRP